MTARRMAGLLIAILMLHLTVVGASVRCAQGSELTVGGHHANGDHAGMVSHARAHTAAQNQSHHVPAQPECCRAMTACALTVALREEAPCGSDLPRDDAIIARLMSAPRSPVASPDTPPPKV